MQISDFRQPFLPWRPRFPGGTHVARVLSAVRLRLESPQEPTLVAWQARLAVAILIGLLATLFAYHQLVGRHWLASDFEYDLRAARRLLAGLNPYHDPSVYPGRTYPYDAQFPYPLFAAMLATPFTVFNSYMAGALYVGCLSGLMAFAVTRRGWWQLCIFLSPCYFVAASVANWSPLLVASAFLPVLYPLTITKPTLALPIMANYRSLPGYLLCLPMLALSLIVLPSWPHLWLQSLAHQSVGKYVSPVTIFPVILVLVAAVWWRNRSARLLVMLALIPQHGFFYDQLLLWLLPKTLRQSLALSAAGWVAYILYFALDPTGRGFLAISMRGPWNWFSAPAFYLPALALIIWQAVAERRARRSIAPGRLESAVPVPALVQEAG